MHGHIPDLICIARCDSNLCNAYAQLGARGTSILFSSGDGGVSGTNADDSCTTFRPTFPSGCPFLTSVRTLFTSIRIIFTSSAFCRSVPPKVSLKRPPPSRQAVSRITSAFRRINVLHSTSVHHPSHPVPSRPTTLPSCSASCMVITLITSVL